MEFVRDGFHLASANYFGLPNPTPTYISVLAEAFVACMNPQLASANRSRLASSIEKETLSWFSERLGWGKHAGGTFTTGGSEGNFSALAMALNRRFPHSGDTGLSAVANRATFYASTEAHYSLDKAAAVLGIGRQSLRRISVDRNSRIDCDSLDRAIRLDLESNKEPFCIVGTLGTTGSGSIDDLKSLAAICQRYNLWFHVDAAYGGALLLSDRFAQLMDGVELGDSIVIDPHKWLAMPFASSIFLTKHPDGLERTFGVAAPYLQSAHAQPDNYQVSFQWSRRMNSLKLWLTLRIHGRRAYEDMFAKQFELAARLSAAIDRSDVFTLLIPPQLPILTARIKLPGGTEAEIAASHQELVKAIVEAGRTWITHTEVDGKSALRIMVISYLSDACHVDSLFAEMEDAAHRIISTRIGDIGSGSGGGYVAERA